MVRKTTTKAKAAAPEVIPAPWDIWMTPKGADAPRLYKTGEEIPVDAVSPRGDTITEHIAKKL